jgi:hypothetical protein
MNQPSGMTLTTRHRAAFLHSELIPADRVAYWPIAARQPIGPGVTAGLMLLRW